MALDTKDLPYRLKSPSWRVSPNDHPNLPSITGMPDYRSLARFSQSPREAQGILFVIWSWNPHNLFETNSPEDRVNSDRCQSSKVR